MDAAAGRSLFSRNSSAVLSPLQDAQESRLNVFTSPGPDRLVMAFVFGATVDS